MLRKIIIAVVLIALLLCAGGVLLTAMARAPAEARRSQCANRCNEIQSAIFQFQEAHGRLPYLVTSIPETPTDDNFLAIGWVPQILCYLDRNHDLYEILMKNEETIGDGKLYDGTPDGTMFVQFAYDLMCPENPGDLGTIRGKQVPLNYVVPPDTAIELWDSGMPVFARPGDTLQTIAGLYRVPLWSLTQINKGVMENVPLVPGERVVVPRNLVPLAEVSR